MPPGQPAHTPSARIRKTPHQPKPPRPLAPSSSFLAFSFVLFFLSGFLSGHPGSFSQCTPCPPPAPLAPFSSFLAFSFVLFFLLGLLRGHPGSFSQRTPSPLPPDARIFFWCVCVSTPVSKEPALHNSPPFQAGGSGRSFGAATNEDVHLIW